MVASAAGVIYSKPTGSGTGYGNQVVFKHGEGDYSQYAHLGWRTTLPVGTRVAQGQPIGAVGTSGTSAYHLHYEQRKTPTGSLKPIQINGSQITYYATKYFTPSVPCK